MPSPASQSFHAAGVRQNDMYVTRVSAERAIKKAIPCEKVGIAVVGLEVLHAHIHLVPMDKMDDINFKNPKLRFSPEVFKEIAAKISRKVIL